MYARVVVGVDFGSSSLEAAHWVVRHLKPEQVVLTHVVRPLRPPTYLRGSLVDVNAVTRAAEREAETRLESLAGELGVDTEPDVRVGDPADLLEAVAVERQADLLVVGEHGQRRYAWPALGRTSFALMARAGVPVLFARTLPPRRPRSLLVAHGAGPESTELIETARSLQRAWDARVLLLHVVDRSFLPLGESGALEIDPRSFEAEIRREAGDWLAELRRKARVRGGDVPLEIALGEPAAELMATLHRGEHDLLVLRGSAAPRPGALPDRVSRILMSAAPVSILRLPGGGGDER